MGKVEAVGDWDVRGQDLRTYYAGFTRRALPDGALWRLSLASSCLPERHPGYKVWLTMVSGTERFCVELQSWSVGLGATVARMKPRLNLRAREFVSSYDHAWGRQASLDGLKMALFGEENIESLRSRSDEFDCDREAYQRIRDFVAGAIVMAAWQYEDALRWAHRVARDA